MDYSLPGSSVCGIFQARILDWAVMPSSRGYSWPRDRTQVSCTAGRPFTAEPPGKTNIILLLLRRQKKDTLWVKVTHLCLTLCHSLDYDPPGSSVCGIFQARILEWVAISCSWRFSRPRDQTCVSSLLPWQVDSLPLAPPRKARR